MCEEHNDSASQKLKDIIERDKAFRSCGLMPEDPNLIRMNDEKPHVNSFDTMWQKLSTVTAQERSDEPLGGRSASNLH